MARDPEHGYLIAEPVKARPLCEWHEDMGPVLWWSFPVQEPPYVGTPIDCPRVFPLVVAGTKCGEFTTGGWPGYHTHWTPLPEVPADPRPPAKCPTCDSPEPRLHPAMQFEGEVQPCRDNWHAR